jgi:hypothetical protein
LCSYQKSLALSRSIVFIRKQKLCLLTLHSVSSFSFFLSFFFSLFFQYFIFDYIFYSFLKKKLLDYIYFFFAEKQRKQRREKWRCKPFTDFSRRDVFSGRRLTLLEGKPLKKKCKKRRSRSRERGRVISKTKKRQNFFLGSI